MCGGGGGGGKGGQDSKLSQRRAPFVNFHTVILVK